MTTKRSSLLFLLVAALLLTAVSFAAPEPVSADGHGCVIPESGPWPPCATGGDTGGNDDCVIPPSGPWPPCATGGDSADSDTCTIPPSGPWPPCATGGEQSDNGADCVIPESGPWPPCATGGEQDNTDQCVIPESGPWPACATGSEQGGDNECVIPPAGPWPPCATGGVDQSTPLRINAFSAYAVTTENYNDEVHISWDTSGADSVEIYVGYAESIAKRYYVDAASGSWVELVTDPVLRIAEVGLVIRKDGQEVRTSIDVQLACEHDYFFPDDAVTYPLYLCPVADAKDWSIAWQPFEHGFMVYAQAKQQENGGIDAPFFPRSYSWPHEGPPAFIAVFVDGNGLSPSQYHYVDVDLWREGDPESDPALTPPEGLYQPVRGFGKIWREGFELQERLGWATSPEMTDSLTYQPTDGPAFISSNVVYYKMPQDYVARHLPERSNYTNFWEYIGAQ